MDAARISDTSANNFGEVCMKESSGIQRFWGFPSFLRFHVLGMDRFAAKRKGEGGQRSPDCSSLICC